MARIKTQFTSQRRSVAAVTLTALALLAGCGAEQNGSSGAATSDCSDDPLGTVKVAGSLQGANETAPGLELIPTIESDAAGTLAGTPATTVTQCTTMSLSVVMSYPSQPVLDPTLNPVQMSERVKALGGGGALTVSDLSTQAGGDQGGGQTGDGSGWHVNFNGATTGTYAWVSPVQWLGAEGVAQQGQISVTVTVS
jgi:hypothetical protein